MNTAMELVDDLVVVVNFSPSWLADTAMKILKVRHVTSCIMVIWKWIKDAYFSDIMAVAGTLSSVRLR